jgi:hypothetical protein
MQTLREATPEKSEKGEWKVSLFSVKPASQKEILDGITSLMQAFPEQPESFWTLLAKRLSVNKISADKFKASVEHLIDHHVYPKITVGDVMSFDKTINLYSYRQLNLMIGKREYNSTDDFVAVHQKSDGSNLYAIKYQLDEIAIKP